MKKFSIALVALAAFATTFTSCKRAEEAQEDFAAEQEMSEHIALSEADFNDVGNIVDEAASGDITSYKTGCASLTHDSTASPKKIIIDFGNVNCLCRDGKNRRGKIVVTYTGRYRDAGTVITTGFDGYFVNDNEVKGTHTVTNKGLNSQNQPYFEIEVNGSIILSGGRGTITRISKRTRTWVAGFNTLAIADDVYSIEGTVTTTGPKGDQSTATIRKALRVEIKCSNIVSGIIDFTRTSKPNRTVSIDYGNGDCDRLATVTLPSGRTVNIFLR